MHVLDNPVWHALTGPHQTVAEARSGAARYAPDVALFAALPDDPGEQSWADLLDLVGPHGIAAIMCPKSPPPAGWEEIFRIPALQMIATSVDPAPADGARVLTEDDVHHMLALVDRTNPGPFEPRTIELGEYIGVDDEHGALGAMAGERLHAPPYREISAVCTDAHLRGRGLASRLVRDLVGRIQARDEIAMLHVVTTNTNAIRLYLELGFTVRAEIAVAGFRAPS